MDNGDYCFGISYIDSTSKFPTSKFYASLSSDGAADLFPSIMKNLF